jgi:hypothetical protein
MSPVAENKRPRLRADQVARPCRLPNGAERVEIYGLDGKLHRIQEPDGSSLEFRYTMDGTLRLVEHSSGERVEYEHRAEQKCLRAANTRSETTVEFDDHGFPVRMVQHVDGFEWTIGYERDHVGRVSACRYPQAIDWLRTMAREIGNEVRSNWRRCTVLFRCGDAQRTDHVSLMARPAHKRPEDSLSDAQGLDELGFPLPTIGGWSDRAITFHYDEVGRLASFVHPSGARVSIRRAGLPHRSPLGATEDGLHYVDQVTPTAIDGEAIFMMHSAAACLATRATTVYGQLTEVTFADGPPVRYLDGFGRLVGRECGGECVYYIVDFDGHRIAEADARGRVQRSYLWLGAAASRRWTV